MPSTSALVLCTLGILAAPAVAYSSSFGPNDQDALEAPPPPPESNELREARLAIARTLLKTEVHRLKSRPILCGLFDQGDASAESWDREAFLVETRTGKLCMVTKCPRGRAKGKDFEVSYCKPSR